MVHGDPELPDITLPIEQPDDGEGTWIPLDGTDYCLKSNGREWLIAKRLPNKKGGFNYSDYAYYATMRQCIQGLFERIVKRECVKSDTLDDILFQHNLAYTKIAALWGKFEDVASMYAPPSAPSSTTRPPAREMVGMGKDAHHVDVTRVKKTRKRKTK
jgi:hypothetical protein